jgi:trk system potassium uptake protein TrkA
VTIQLLEADRARAVALAEQLPNAKVIHADGTNPDTLRDIQVESAQVLVATTDEDEINLTTALLARQLGVRYTFTVVERAGYTDIYQHFGITGVVSRQEVTSKAMIAVFERDAAHSKVPLRSCQHIITDVTVPAGATSPPRLQDLALPPQTHLVAHVRGTVLLPIKPEREVHARDVLVVATLDRHVSGLRRMMHRLTS